MTLLLLDIYRVTVASSRAAHTRAAITPYEAYFYGARTSGRSPLAGDTARRFIGGNRDYDLVY